MGVGDRRGEFAAIADVSAGEAADLLEDAAADLRDPVGVTDLAPADADEVERTSAAARELAQAGATRTARPEGLHHVDAEAYAADDHDRDAHDGARPPREAAVGRRLRGDPSLQEEASRRSTRASSKRATIVASSVAVSVTPAASSTSCHEDEGSSTPTTKSSPTAARIAPITSFGERSRSGSASPPYPSSCVVAAVGRGPFLVCETSASIRETTRDGARQRRYN